MQLSESSFLNHSILRNGITEIQVSWDFTCFQRKSKTFVLLVLKKQDGKAHLVHVCAPKCCSGTDSFIFHQCLLLLTMHVDFQFDSA